MPRLLHALAACVAALPLCAHAAPATIYHFVSNWNGVPDAPQASGWHVLSPDATAMGAGTGVMVFLSHWDAARKCWGSAQDCRPPAWAMQQHLAYVGPASVSGTRLFVETRK